MALVLLAGVATAFGTWPYVLLVHKLWLLPVFVGIAVVTALFSSRNVGASSASTPGVLEFALAGVAAVALPAALTFVAVVLYISGYYALLIVLQAASWLGVGSRAVAESVAFWVAFPLSSLLVLMGALLTGSRVIHRVAAQLYPGTAGLRSAFYSLATFRPARAYSRIGVFAAALATGVIVTLVGSQSRDAVLLVMPAFSALLLGATAPLYRVGVGDELPKELASVIQAVKTLFEADDFLVVADPRTGRDDLDPLLVRAPHIVAQRADRAYAIQVKVKTTSDRTDEDTRKTISDLTSAAWALGNFLKQNVEPLVVLVGVEPSGLMKIHEAKRELRVLRLADETMLQRVAGTGDLGDRRKLAREVLETEVFR